MHYYLFVILMYMYTVIIYVTMINNYPFLVLQWVITEKACTAYSMVPVALYDTLGDDAITFIVEQS